MGQTENKSHMLNMYLIESRNGPLILPNKYDIRRVRKK